MLLHCKAFGNLKSVLRSIIIEIVRMLDMFGTRHEIQGIWISFHMND
jgi:hypothetical protein